MSIEETIEELKLLPSAFVTDAMRRLGLSGWTEGVYPSSGRARHIVGRAATMKYGPKGSGGGGKAPPTYRIIADCRPGDVLVFAAQGSPCWVLGENFCHFAEYQGLAGFVVDGCVRDFDEIAEMSWPVFCRGGGIRPWSAHIDLVGVSEPVEFAGATIRPGDILVGDGDGIAVVPAERAAEVVENAREIAAMEKEKEEAIKRRVPVEELIRMSAAKKAPKKG